MRAKTLSEPITKVSPTRRSRNKRKNNVYSDAERGHGTVGPKAALCGFFPRLLTAADLAMLPSDLPSGPVVYELDNGRLVVMPPPGDIHGAVETILASELRNQGDKRGHGKTRSGGVGVILRKDPDRVVGPDAVFVSKSSLPIRTSKEGYLETIPELVV